MGNQANSKVIIERKRPLPQNFVPKFTRVKQKGLLFHPKDPLQPKHVDDEGLAYELDLDEDIDPALRDTVAGSFHYKFNPACILRHQSTPNTQHEESKDALSNSTTREYEGGSHLRSPHQHLIPYLLEIDRKTSNPSFHRAKLTPRTESSLLNDSAFAPIRRSTFNLTTSTLGGALQPKRVRLNYHRRVVSQLPQPLERQSRKCVDIEIPQSQYLFTELPELDDTRIVETYRKLHQTKKNRSKSCLSRPVAIEEAHGEAQYNSFIAVEIDDVFGELAQEPEEATYLCMEKTMLVNKSNEIALVSKSEISSDGNFESMIAAEEGSQMDEHNRRNNNPIILLPKFDTRMSQQPEIPKITVVHINLNPHETIFECTEENNTERRDFDTQEAVAHHADNSSFLPEEQTFANVEIEEREYEYRIKSVKWIPNSFKQNRSDSISTNDIFSNKHSKNNSEDIQRPIRFRTLERKSEVEEQPEIEKLTVRGKFVESFVLGKDEPEPSIGDQSFENERESEKPESIYQSNYISPIKRYLQEREGVEAGGLTYRTELMFQQSSRS